MSCKKKLFWETLPLEILKFIYINKNMSVEDDIFLAEASPIADRRELPYVYYIKEQNIDNYVWRF
jgi:hypothetical protein